MEFPARQVVLKHTKLGRVRFLAQRFEREFGTVQLSVMRQPISHISHTKIFNHYFENLQNKDAMANNRQIVNQRLTNPVTSTRFQQTVNSPMRIAATKLVHAPRISPRAVVALENL